MDLDDLLEQEGLDDGGADEALQWARARAEELVRGMSEDPELGPLLSGAAAVPEAEAPAPGTSPQERPPLHLAGEPGAAESLASDEHDTTAPVVTDDSEPVGDPPSYGLSAAQQELAAAEAELAAAQAELAAVEGEGQPAEAEPELDPLAGIDFDSMPGDDEALDTDQPPPVMEVPLGSLPLPQGDTLVPTDGPDSTIPSMKVPLEGHDVTLATMPSPEMEGTDITVRAANPLEGGEPPAEAAADGGDGDGDEEEIEEIELLDDDMIELVEDDDDDADEADMGGDEDEVPEWKAALTSAQLGGGPQADEDSGLLRPPSSPEPEPEAPVDDDEDVDLGDL